MLRACCFLVVWIGICAATFAQGDVVFDEGFDPLEKARGASNERIKEIEAILAKKVHVAFHEIPLEEVVDFLHDKYGAPILIDQPSLDLLGIGEDAPITFNADGVRMDNYLRAMLRPLDLTYGIRNGFIYITAPEEISAALSVRIYDVSRIISPRNNQDVVYADSLPSYEYNDLLDIIMSTVEPDMWEQLGGPGTLQTFSRGDVRLLIVSQTDENQKTIAHLLHFLKEKVQGKTARKGNKRKQRFSIIYQIDRPENVSFDDLVRIIKTTIADASWKKKNAIKIIGDTIVVHQPAGVQQRVKQLLLTLNALSQRPPVQNNGVFPPTNGFQ